MFPARDRRRLSASMAAALCLVVAGLASGAPTAGACSLLDRAPCGPAPTVPATDPGGSETAPITLPPDGGRRFGFSSYNSVVRPQRLTPEREAALIVTAGGNVHRLDASWSLAQPRAGRFNDAFVDSLAAAAKADRRRGILPLLILGNAPRWASAETCLRRCHVGLPPDPARLQLWREYVRHIAHEVPGAAFQVWNEPNLRVFWRSGADPVALRPVLTSAYDVLREAVPTATIVGPAINGRTTSGDGSLSLLTYTTSLLADDLLGRLPELELAFNLYPHGTDLGTGSLWAQQWAQVRQSLASAGAQRVPVWVTETGASTTEPASGLDNDAQGEVIERLVRRLFTMPEITVKAVIVHTLLDPPGFGADDPEGGYGVLDGRAVPKGRCGAWCRLRAAAAPACTSIADASPQVTVRPRRLRVGRRTRLSITAVTVAGDGTRCPLGGAVVTYGKRRTQTGAGGRARLTVRPRRAGSTTARVRLPGGQRVRRVLRVSR